MKPNYLQETYLKHKNIERFKEIEKRQIISVCNLVMLYHSFAKCRRNWANYTRNFRVLFLTTVYKCTIILIELQLEKEVRQISTKHSCGKISTFSVHQKHLESLLKQIAVFHPQFLIRQVKGETNLQQVPRQC